MTTATQEAGNPSTDKPFNPATASADELRAALDAPTTLDNELTGNEPDDAEPEPEPENDLPEEGTPEHEEEVQGQEEQLQEEGAEEPPPEEDPDTLKKMRLRPRDKLDQQVMDLYKSEGFEGTFQDAVNIIYGKPNLPDNQQQPQREEAPADPAAESSKELTTVRDEIKELESQLDAALEEFDNAKAAKLQRDLTRLEVKAARIEDRIERDKESRQVSVEQTRRQQAAESRERAVEKYPVLDDKESIERKQFDAFLDRASQDPALAPILNSPLWPEILADRFAAETGITARTKAPAREETPAAPAKKKAAPVTGSKAKQLTSGDTAQPEQTITPETLRQNMKSMKRDDLEALLGRSG